MPYKGGYLYFLCSDWVLVNSRHSEVSQWRAVRCFRINDIEPPSEVDGLSPNLIGNRIGLGSVWTEFISGAGAAKGVVDIAIF